MPARPSLLAAIVGAAVRAAAPFGVPVTAKFRIGLDDALVTHLRAGQVCADEGVVAIALHARSLILLMAVVAVGMRRRRPTVMLGVLLVGSVIVTTLTGPKIGALTYFPALSLGPIVEHYLMHTGKLFSMLLPVHGIWS